MFLRSIGLAHRLVIASVSRTIFSTSSIPSLTRLLAAPLTERGNPGFTDALSWHLSSHEPLHALVPDDGTAACSNEGGGRHPRFLLHVGPDGFPYLPIFPPCSDSNGVMPAEASQGSSQPLQLVTIKGGFSTIAPILRENALGAAIFLSQEEAHRAMSGEPATQSGEDSLAQPSVHSPPGPFVLSSGDVLGIYRHGSYERYMKEVREVRSREEASKVSQNSPPYTILGCLSWQTAISLQ